MNTIAIIPARGGSKRIKNKNIKLFCGKPILSYSIETAQGSHLFDEVMVSTNSRRIAQVATDCGASVPFFRSNKNSDDQASTRAVIHEVLKTYEKLGKSWKYCCCIYPTAPFLNKKLLIEAYNLLVESKVKSVVPLTPYDSPIQRAFKIDGDAKAVMVDTKFMTYRSQDLEKRYFDPGMFYWLRVDTFMKEMLLFTTNTLAVKVPSKKAQDINTIEDWEIAEMKYQILNKE